MSKSPSSSTIQNTRSTSFPNPKPTTRTCVLCHMTYDIKIKRLNIRKYSSSMHKTATISTMDDKVFDRSSHNRTMDV